MVNNISWFNDQKPEMLALGNGKLIAMKISGFDIGV